MKSKAILAARGQMLAFEPVDLGPATGAPGGALSIGGVFATNFSGSRRTRWKRTRQSSGREGGERPCRALQIRRARNEKRHRSRRGAQA
jgi:hypothetical protein